MNSQRIAQLRISPLHVQQGLFLLLALLVTLIAIQQFQRWSQANEATETRQQIIHSSVSYRSRQRSSGPEHCIEPAPCRGCHLFE